MAVEPVTRATLRRYLFLGGVLFGALILGLTFKGQVDGVNDLRAGCERGNVQREALYQNTLRDALTRAAAVPQFTGRPKGLIALYAINGFAEAQGLVNTYASVAAHPGSVESDCGSAYPYPWPLG